MRTKNMFKVKKLIVALMGCLFFTVSLAQKPNILFVFADQLRSQELSCYGGVNIKTPNLDRLADEGLMMTNAISTYPICSPFRGMLLTGLYPLKSGISNNDHPLNPELPSFAKSCKKEGYNTAYIGKWHIDGIGRTAYIPEERRLGYDHWQALECTHNYFKSLYFHNNEVEPKYWKGFDAEAQTKAAQDYIRARDTEKPFFLTLSWGPPHDPYIAPQEYMDKVEPKKLILRENVTEHLMEEELQNNPRFKIPERYIHSHAKLRVRAKDENIIRKRYAGYLAATLALDDYIGELLQTLEEEGILDNTIVVFTSDHGDQLGSHQFYGKNVPFAESISIPFLVRYPKVLKQGTIADNLLSPIDMFSTVFGMANIDHHEIDGVDLTPAIVNEAVDARDAILLMNLTHFNNTSLINGLDTYRGIQTKKYTYARYEDKTPWLLFDNENDPFQVNNLVGNSAYTGLIKTLDKKLDKLLIEAQDPENTKEIYDRIMRENPKRIMVNEFRKVNPDL
ncbi:sulfatase [uncultured Draconibacterium sp.]|uniref:sulfatase family protein n=1 Tax=uncultured Draconibacterium sp. TaxID=1573823 RepID=UPI003261B021